MSADQVLSEHSLHTVPLVLSVYSNLNELLQKRLADFKTLHDFYIKPLCRQCSNYHEVRDLVDLFIYTRFC